MLARVTPAVAEARGQEATGLGDQPLAGVGEPALAGRAVDLVDAGDIGGAQALDRLQTQQRALLVAQQGQRRREGLAELDPIVALEVLELGVLADPEIDQAILGGVVVTAVALAPLEVDAQAQRDDLEPRAQRAAPGVLRDPRRPPVGGHEQPREQLLAQVLGVAAADRQAGERGRELAPVAALKRGQRRCVAAGAGLGEVEVIGAQRRERGHGVEFGGHARVQALHEVRGRQFEARPGAARGLEARAQELLEGRARRRVGERPASGERGRVVRGHAAERPGTIARAPPGGQGPPRSRPRLLTTDGWLRHAIGARESPRRERAPHQHPSTALGP